MTKNILPKNVRDILVHQNLGVLATYGKEYPYTSLVGFVADEECKNIIFATLKNTKKYLYITDNPKVSMLVNSGINNSSDFKDAVSITAFGTGFDVEEEKMYFNNIYLKKFPVLEDFINDPDCVLVRIEVEKYMVVSNFQDVKEIVMK